MSNQIDPKNDILLVRDVSENEMGGAVIGQVVNSAIVVTGGYLTGAYSAQTGKLSIAFDGAGLLAAAAAAPSSGGGNLGAGANVFSDVLSNNLRFRSIIGGNGVKVVEGIYDITLSLDKDTMGINHIFNPAADYIVMYDDTVSAFRRFSIGDILVSVAIPTGAIL